MITALKTPLRRELHIGKADYVLTISPHGLKLALKGKRKGYEVDWAALVSGDAALATALNASLQAPLLPKAAKAAARIPSAAKKRTR
jgi:hypothetical protein